MTSSKVSSSAPVGHSTSLMKLGSVKSASSASTSIAAVGDSSNIGSATEQYLMDDSSEYRDYRSGAQEDGAASAVPAAFSVLDPDTAAGVQLQLDGTGAFISVQEVEQHVETYEKTLEQTDAPVRKKTQGFG